MKQPGQRQLRVGELIRHDYSDRFKDPTRIDQRPLLAAERSLGSVIKLLTPDLRDYSAVNFAPAAFLLNLRSQGQYIFKNTFRN